MSQTSSFKIRLRKVAPVSGECVKAREEMVNKEPMRNNADTPKLQSWIKCKTDTSVGASASSDEMDARSDCKSDMLLMSLASITTTTSNTTTTTTTTTRTMDSMATFHQRSTYGFSNRQSELMELKRKQKFLQEKAGLISRLMNINMNNGASRTGDKTTDNASESAEEGNKEAEEKVMAACKKTIRTASADESVVEVSKDSFAPTYAKDIDFHVLQLPQSQQLINASSRKELLGQDKSEHSASCSSVHKTTKPNTICKSKTKSKPSGNRSTAKSASTSSTHCNSNSNSSNRLRPLNLDSILATVDEASQEERAKSANSLPALDEEDKWAKQRGGSSKKPTTNSLPDQLNHLGLHSSKVEKRLSECVKSWARSNSKEDMPPPPPPLPPPPPPVAQSSSKSSSKSGSKSGSKSSNSTATAVQRSASKIQQVYVNNKCYHVLNKIGRGGSSLVYQVYQAESKTTYALKIVDLSKSDGAVVEGFRNEIKLLKKLRHCKRVVRLEEHEFRKDNKELRIVMEKGDDDLANVLKSFCQETKLSQHMIRFYWYEMLKVVNEIHQNSVVHSDLKPVNFILVSGKLKLIDFGIANAIQSNKTSVYKEHIIGTVDYMAPESFLKKAKVEGVAMVKYNQKADIWSLGIILYNLVYGCTPFAEYRDNMQKSYAIVNSSIEYGPIDDPLLLDVIKQCLQNDPAKRPTAAELLNHPYLTQQVAPAVAPSAAANLALCEQIDSLTPKSRKAIFSMLAQKIKTCK